MVVRANPLWSSSELGNHDAAHQRIATAQNTASNLAFLPSAAVTSNRGGNQSEVSAHTRVLLQCFFQRVRSVFVALKTHIIQEKKISVEISAS